MLGMFFEPPSTENCILNSASANTHPDLYIEFNEEPVTYFEPCPCKQQQQQQYFHTCVAI